jgi:hypothetical protein
VDGEAADGRLDLGALRARVGRLAEADDLLPAARDVVAEDEEEVAGAAGGEAELDRLLLVEGHRDAVVGDALGAQLGDEDVGDLAGGAAAQAVVLADDEAVEHGGGGAGDLLDVVVAAITGSREDADPLALDVEAGDEEAIARTAAGLWP